MNIEELQALWKNQPAGAVRDEAALVSAIREESRRFDEKIRRRDGRELMAGILLAAMFAVPLRPAQGPVWARIVAMIIVLAIPFVAIAARRKLARRRAASAGNVRSELQHAIDETRLQVRLLSGVVWWYLLPLWVASVFSGIAKDGELTARWWKVQLWLILPFMIFVYWLNHRTARRKLQPQLDRLTASHAEWNRLERDGEQ